MKRYAISAKTLKPQEKEKWNAKFFKKNMQTETKNYDELTNTQNTN
jgi:hypothetical protein